MLTFKAQLKPILLVAVCMLISIGANAQINLQLKNVTVSDAITALNRTQGYSVSVNSGDVDLNKVVSVNASSASLNEVLDQIFAGQQVTYSIKGKSISVTRKPAAVSNVIPGTVCDENGDPLIGASVRVKGSSMGFITDMDGKFALKDVKFPATLVVSFIGYSDQEVVVNGSEKSVNVVFTSSMNLLDEVVVVGYGTQKKVNVTGAVSVIEGKVLNNRPVTNTATAIQGADPSLFLSMDSGSIEAKNYSLNIRGATSISSSASPLILVDGVSGSLTQVNPNDIESVSVLKDASASAIYGAEASAGVILITTKSGSEGNATVQYTGRYSVSSNTTSTDFMTTSYDFINYVNEASRMFYGYNTWGFSDAQMAEFEARRNDKSEVSTRPWVIPDETNKYTYLYLGNFDWYGYLYKRQRPENEHNVTVRGGTDKVRYYISGRILNRDGFFNGNSADNYTGYNFRAKVDAKVNSFIDYTANVSYEYTDYSYGGFWEQDGSEGNVSAGILWNSTQNCGPMFVPINPDGTINMYPGYMADATSPLFSGRIGPLLADTNSNSRKNNYVTITNRLKVKICKPLSFTVDYTYKRRDRLYQYRSLPTPNSWDNINKRLYVGNGLTGGFFSNGSVYDFTYEKRYNNVMHEANGYFNYAQSFGDHNFSATAGVNLKDFRSDNLNIRQVGSISDDLSFINSDQGTIDLAKESISAYSMLGFFARANYDFAGKYLLEFSARYDASSRFPAGSKWGFFPGVSAGWRISEEPFFAPLKSVVNNAKLRLSYGSLGNNQVSDYGLVYDTITTGTLGYTFDGLSKASYAKQSNPRTEPVTWETVTTSNLGLDLGFFNDKLVVTADAYIRDTKNMLVNSVTLPDVYGASEPKANVGDMRTKGYELTVTWRDGGKLLGKPFTYGVSASLGDHISVITRYENEDKVLTDHYVGKTIGEIWGYKTDGLFKTDEEAAEYEASIDCRNVQKRVFGRAAPNNHLLAGDIKFLDLDDDDKITSGNNTADKSGDRVIIGNSKPRYLYGLKGDFSWNGFDFSVFFQGVGHIDWMPASTCTYFWGVYSYQRPTFLAKDLVAQSWNSAEGADNSNAYFPRLSSRLLDATGLVANDRYLQNAAYLRLKNLTLGYTLPVKTNVFKKVRVYASGENLFYWSPLKKHCLTVDPEIATTGAADDMMYPYSKTLTLGVDITF